MCKCRNTTAAARKAAQRTANNIPYSQPAVTPVAPVHAQAAIPAVVAPVHAQAAIPAVVAPVAAPVAAPVVPQVAPLAAYAQQAVRVVAAPLLPARGTVYLNAFGKPLLAKA